MPVLESVEWSGPALSLLNHCAELDRDRPAVMHIRHTERTSLVIGGASGDNMLSTPVGIAAAVDFGTRLPGDRRYRLYHTYVQRARETAEAIRDGVVSHGGSAEIFEEVPFRYSIDRDAIQRYLGKVRERCGSEDATAVEFTNEWLAGLVSPPSCILPSYEFARTVADYTFSRLESATTNTLDIYVSHDTYVGSVMFHWFGVPVHQDGIAFLDGFLVQLEDDGMVVWFRNKRMVLDYPHWWRT
jgi:broad specificity phosphatase PhoE